MTEAHPSSATRAPTAVTRVRVSTFVSLVYLRDNRLLGRVAYWALRLLLGADIPCGVRIGQNFVLPHGGLGVVIHPLTRIEDDVTVYHGVTLGRADIWVPMKESRFEGILVRSGAILGAGAKVLCKSGTLIIGCDAVIGANAVVTESVGAGEVWAGVPARCIGRVEARFRRHPDCSH